MTTTRYNHIIADIMDRLGIDRTEVDPRWIEGYIRLEHPTLDFMDRDQLAAEIKMAADLVHSYGADLAERVADSLAL